MYFPFCSVSRIGREWDTNISVFRYLFSVSDNMQKLLFDMGILVLVKSIKSGTRINEQTPAPPLAEGWQFLRLQARASRCQITRRVCLRSKLPIVVTAPSQTA